MSELRPIPVAESPDQPTAELFQELPPLLARGVTYLLALMLAAALIYASIGKVDVTVSVPGRLVPDGLSRPVQSLTAGRVRTLTVREGEAVRAGQALVYLEADEADAALRRAQAEREIRRRQLSDLLVAGADASALAEARARAAEAEASVTAARRAAEGAVLLSPATGTLTRLLPRGPGDAVQAGQVVAEVAPEGAGLVFEARAANRDTGLLGTGQKARLRLDAYPYQEYGTVGARVRTISPDAIAAEDGSLGYRLLLDVDPAEKKSRIAPRLGLSGTAEVVTERRRILHLFFKNQGG